MIAKGALICKRTTGARSQPCAEFLARRSLPNLMGILRIDDIRSHPLARPTCRPSHPNVHILPKKYGRKIIGAPGYWGRYPQILVPGRSICCITPVGRAYPWPSHHPDGYPSYPWACTIHGGDATGARHGFRSSPLLAQWLFVWWSPKSTCYF